MKAAFRKAKAATGKEKRKVEQVKSSAKGRPLRPGRERVLVEFPLNLLERADDAASKLEKNRSELIRMSVERMLDEMEKEKFEAELAAAYAANARMNIDLTEEFVHVDREGME